MRKLCTSCKQPARINEEERELSGLTKEDILSVEWYEGVGCEHCGHTGYRGRTIIVELLELSSRLRQMILEGKTMGELVQIAREEGMITLRESALALGRAGLTSLKEINRVTFVE